jgi:hypothetical protein
MLMHGISSAHVKHGCMRTHWMHCTLLIEIQQPDDGYSMRENITRGIGIWYTTVQRTMKPFMQ